MRITPTLMILTGPRGGTAGRTRTRIWRQRIAKMPEQQTTDETPLDQAVWLIASMLDHPSVFMGGPSQRSIRRARDIINALKDEGMMP